MATADDIFGGYDGFENVPSSGVETDGDELGEDPDYSCTDPAGHSWTYTGTSYGGDDDRFCGEGRCICANCGADGDG